MPNTESNTLRYKSGRIPVIALDYSSRQLAQKRELLVDYKNAKLYVVSAEDRTVIYDLTSNIIKAFKESGGTSDFTIEIEGLGTYKLGDIINQLYTSKIDLIEDKEFQYNAPTVSFDNKSLAIYDRQASMLNFNRANDRTVPMKKDDALVWMPFDLENLENRLLKLENTSVPDIEEWKSFRTRLAAVEATDELYKDLPNMKASISINAAGIKDLSNRVNALDINTVKDNITTLTNTVNTHNAKIKTDEANLELLTKKVNDDDAILQLLEERANTNLATLTDLLSRTTKLENINANDRLSTVENDIVNINSQLASVASSENISNIDERLHALEDKYPVDISSLTTDVTALKTKTATHDSAIPELQEKVATLEQNVASLSGIDIDQINNNIDQKINIIKQTVDSYSQSNASLQTLVDQIKTNVDSYSSSIQTLQDAVNNIPNKYLSLTGGTLSGDLTAPSFHGVADSAITIKDINSKASVYGNTKLVTVDKNGDMGTINGITTTEDSLTVPFKVTVNDISCKTITDIQTSLGNKLEDAPVSTDTADKLFTTIYNTDERNTTYDIAGSEMDGTLVAPINSTQFKDKAILYIDKTDNKLKVFSIEAIKE